MGDLRFCGSGLLGFFGFFWFAALAATFRATAIDVDHDPLNGDACRPNINESSRADQRQLHACLDNDLHACLEVNLTHRSRLLSDVATHLGLAVAADRLRKAPVDFLIVIAIDDQMAVTFDMS